MTLPAEPTTRATSGEKAGPVTHADARPISLLFLTSATGGGHQAAAAAVAEAMERQYPGRYAPVLCDPLTGPGSAWPLRWVTSGYGWLIRYVPWLWGLLYRATDSRLAARLVHGALAWPAGRTVQEAVDAHRPAVIVSFHALTGQAAIRARVAGTPVVTIITDLGPPHATWTWPPADRIVAASQVGVPVGSQFLTDQFLPDRSLPDSPDREERGAHFMVLLIGGAEGAGKLARQATAIADRLPDVDVAVICGRNRLLYRRLAARSGGRVRVHGFVSDMGTWLRAADVVATKAGPATIAEAACCGTAMMLTGYLPGQERDNVGLVTSAGAGVYWPRPSRLAEGIARLRANPTELASMRVASARLARPEAADKVAALLAELAEIPRQE
jgi:1,2-diacylglycerol 3-beta-galactosyltransferase